MGRQAWMLIGVAVALSVGLALLDIAVGGEEFRWADFAFDVFERVIMVATFVAVAWAVVAVREARAEQAELRADLARAVARGEDWRSESREALADLGAAITRQFKLWSLTRAESDIAGLMLKGVPLRQIAELRQTSETTIRQQAQSVYRKSGLSGRAELSAYFLESLFEARAESPASSHN